MGDWFYCAPPKWKYTTQLPEEKRLCPQCKSKPIIQGSLDNLLRESFKIPKCNLGFRCDKCPFEICQMIDEKREDNEEELI